MNTELTFKVEKFKTMHAMQMFGNMIEIVIVSFFMLEYMIFLLEKKVMVWR